MIFCVCNRDNGLNFVHLLHNGPRDHGVPLTLWILCLLPGNWNYVSQCQSLVKRKRTIYLKVIQV